MYPDKLPFEYKKQHWYADDFFCNDRFHFVHTYLHPDYHENMHYHHFYEMNIITSGAGRHYIKDTYVSAKTGDVFVIPPDISHGYYSDGRIDILHILIKNEFVEKYREELESIAGYGLLFDIEPYIRWASSGSCNLNLDYVELNIINHKVNDILDAEKNRQYVYQNALAFALICKLSNMLNSEVKHSNTSDETNYDVLIAMEYIKNNLERKITLDDICTEVNVSKATLNRHFKATLNISPMDYALNCRVSEAKRLISQGGLSRTQIAQICGFYDLSHMNKCIQKPV